MFVPITCRAAVDFTKVNPITPRMNPWLAAGATKYTMKKPPPICRWRPNIGPTGALDFQFSIAFVGDRVVVPQACLVGMAHG